MKKHEKQGTAIIGALIGVTILSWPIMIFSENNSKVEDVPPPLVIPTVELRDNYTPPTKTPEELRVNYTSPTKTPKLIRVKNDSDYDLIYGAIYEYMDEIDASKELKDLIPLILTLSKLYDIDPLRPTAIILHETGNGHSKAMQVNRNVCGLNWTERQKELLDLKTDIYNLAVEKTHEASVTNLMVLLKYYRDNWGLEYLSEIQVKYAPLDDPRNGLSGMDNSVWLKQTIFYYRQIEAKL